MCLLICFSLAATDGDRDFKMCGWWLHNGSSQSLDIDLMTGCTGINISANASTLSIRGSITAQCVQSKVLHLEASQGFPSNFCVFWEPLLDQMMVELNGKNFSFCNASGLKSQCCTYLSPGHQSNSQWYGIEDGNLRGDPLTNKVVGMYEFIGEWINCSKFP